MQVQGTPPIGTMSIELLHGEFTVKANFKDPDCCEINFVQFFHWEPQSCWHLYEEIANPGWKKDVGRGEEATPNPPFYLPHGDPGAVSGGEFGHIAVMTDAPGSVGASGQWTFITCAVCAEGNSRGTVYACKKWSFWSNSSFFQLFKPKYEDFEVEDITVEEVNEILPPQLSLHGTFSNYWPLEEWDVGIRPRSAKPE